MTPIAIFAANGPAKATDSLKTALFAVGSETAADDGFALLLAASQPNAAAAGKQVPQTGKFLPVLPQGLQLSAVPPRKDGETVADAISAEEEAPSEPLASPAVANPMAGFASLIAMSKAAAHGLPQADSATVSEHTAPPMAQMTGADLSSDKGRGEITQNIATPGTALPRTAHPGKQEAEASPATSSAPIASPATSPTPAAASHGAQPQDSFSLEVSRIAAEPSLTQPAAPSSAAARDTSGAIRPHDFAVLVDRLVEAREASGPRSANLTVNHADFGAVTMRFEHGERGLAVALSSPDPDFSRAVTAAAAALPAQPERDGSQQGANGNPGASARQDATASAGQGQGSPQGQHRSEAGRDDRPGRHDRADHDLASSDNAKPQTRNRKGIFA